MGENRHASHLCVGKPPILALRIGMKTLKVLIEKVRTTQNENHINFLPLYITLKIKYILEHQVVQNVLDED